MHKEMLILGSIASISGVVQRLTQLKNIYIKSFGPYSAFVTAFSQDKVGTQSILVCENWRLILCVQLQAVLGLWSK
jgi:hypothetical protein